MSSFTHTRTFAELGFDEAIEKVTAALKEEGFGVLTEIDIKATFKAKIDVDFRPYKILGACNPQLAYQALQGEPQVGALLPCNAVVAEAEDGNGVMISLISAKKMFELVDDERVAPIADEVDARLARVLERLG
jgi:uncharacterized protein (DUF302 family)